MNDVYEQNDLRELRLTHFKHEPQVYAAAALHLLGALIQAPLAVSIIYPHLGNPEQLGASLLFGGVSALTATLYVALYVGLTRFQSWARIISSLLALPMLMAFPIGTLLGALILRAYWSASGRVVFTPLYRDAVAATPDMKTRTSIVIWLALGVIGLIAILVTLSFIL